MTDAEQRTQHSQGELSLASLFSKAHLLAASDALLTALLVGGAATAVVLQWCEFEYATEAALALGAVVALLSYLALQPESLVTACLVSARKRVLDGEITAQECLQQRKSWLRRQLLY